MWVRCPLKLDELPTNNKLYILFSIEEIDIIVHLFLIYYYYNKNEVLFIIYLFHLREIYKLS